MDLVAEEGIREEGGEEEEERREESGWRGRDE